jgi:hypothetical protein
VVVVVMAGPASKRKAPPYGWPIVSTLQRAAGMFGLEPGRLAAAVAAAGLRPWGLHADGSAVYRFMELAAVARELGVKVPTRAKGAVPLSLLNKEWKP